MAEFQLAFTWELPSPTSTAGSSAAKEIPYDFTTNKYISRYNFPIWFLILWKIGKINMNNKLFFNNVI